MYQGHTFKIFTDKDPGPPVCEPPFCDTGGNIDTGSLPENDIYFFHPDHLGSTSYITNISGETVQFNSYLPFGETFVSQRRTTTISAYLFNGKEQDPETGLYYYGARYYNPKISNWLSVDPIALYDPIDEVEHYLDGQHNGGYFNPRNTSVYGYTYQNPIIYIDPNGKQALVIGVEKPSNSAIEKKGKTQNLDAPGGAGYGHVFFYIVDKNNKATNSFSFGPAQQMTKEGQYRGVSGTIKYGIYENAILFKTDISQASYDKLKSKMSEYEKDIPTYRPATNRTCAEQAIEIIGEVIPLGLLNVDGKGNAKSSIGGYKLTIPNIVTPLGVYNDLNNNKSFQSKIVDPNNSSLFKNNQINIGANDINNQSDTKDKKRL